MENKNTEKIIEKIKKVLELSKNNPSEEEAKSAALKAQKLMAEYHISMAEIDTIEDVSTIMEKTVDVGMGNKWKYQLARIIARNFRCKYFYYGKSVIVFYGYEEDAEIAAMTFKFLFRIGNKAATNFYQNERNKAMNDCGWFEGKGLKNAFLIGYLDGIKECLDKQCTALMIVIPTKVEEKYTERSANFKVMQNNGLRISGSALGEQARTEGRRTGRNAMSSRQIAAAR